MKLMAHPPAFLPSAHGIPELHQALKNKSAGCKVRGHGSPDRTDPVGYLKRFAHFSGHLYMSPVSRRLYAKLVVYSFYLKIVLTY